MHCDNPKIQIPTRLQGKYNEVVNSLIDHADVLNMEKLILFGSVARGDAKLSSDLDFLVVVEDHSYVRKVSKAIEVLDLREDVGPVCCDIIVRSKDFIEGDSIFAKAIRKDGVTLWEILK